MYLFFVYKNDLQNNSIIYFSHNMFASTNSTRARHSSLAYTPLYVTVCYTYVCRIGNIPTPKPIIS